jgi:hypothetical protein
VFWHWQAGLALGWQVGQALGWKEPEKQME